MSQLAVVTGASSGIGLELARCCAAAGHDLVLAADEPMDQAGAILAPLSSLSEQVEVDLATEAGVDTLIDRIGDRPVDYLLANAGRGLGHGFVDQDWAAIRRVIDTNVTGTVYLTHRIARRMALRGQGRILLTGSIAGFMPGTYQAVYNATKAFIDSFAVALRHELQDSGVSVTVLMPGVTEMRFFERADMLDTKVGQSAKADAAEVARAGFAAMLDGDTGVVPGFKNKLQVAAARMLSSDTLAERHRKMAEPGSGEQGERSDG